MPNIHSSGEPIEELDGTIQGGTTVIMHSLSELADMARLCALAGNSNEPMHALYGLVNSREPIDIPVAAPFHWLEPQSGDFDHKGRALTMAFSYIWDLWKTAPDWAELTCCLTIARPEHDMRLDIDVAQPGLVIHYGSLLATLVSGPLRVFGWSIGLFSSRGIAGSTRARRIMEDVRRKALNQSGTQPLERLDNLPPDYLRGKSAVIVLMHGLLSTDAGFFDPLLQLLRGDSAFEDCAIVGWPHNTLTGIGENAAELLPLFLRAVGTNGPDIAFICHSRGGLVARAAAVELYEANATWLQKVKACVTFGTPHEGSSLAEAPGDLMGKVVAVQSFRKGDGFYSLSDALHFVHGQPSIQGILDLRPIGGGGEFLRDLVRREAKSAPPGAERALPVFAIGGKAEGRGFFAELSQRAMGGADNDLIVETSSSATRYSVEQLVTKSEHFDYLRNSQTQADSFGPVKNFLRERLGLGPAASSANTMLLETENDIVVSRIRLKKRHASYTAAKPATAP